MTFFRSLLACLALSTATTVAFAAAPATNSAPPASAPAKKEATARGKTAGQPAAPASLFDSYIKDLTTALNLTDAEKQEIKTYYLDDGPELKNILNDETLSPLQQAREVSDLRSARNARIETLLDDWRRQHEFLKIEARYRVALTELAASGGPAAATSPAAPAAK
jgi:hypothetical protein